MLVLAFVVEPVVGPVEAGQVDNAAHRFGSQAGATLRRGPVPDGEAA